MLDKLLLGAVAGAFLAAPVFTFADSAPNPVAAICAQYGRESLRLSARTLTRDQIVSAFRANKLAADVCTDATITESSKLLVLQAALDELRNAATVKTIKIKPAM